MDTEDHNSDPDQSDYFLKFFFITIWRQFFLVILQKFQEPE